MTTDIHFTKLAILGVGLLGGSIGLALRRAGFAGRIEGFGHRQASLDVAVASGSIDAGYLDLTPALHGADLVVLASPIGLFEKLMRDSAPLLADGAIVTDVGSTKRQVVAWAKKLLPRRVTFVGSHPIAGSDKRGVQFARADLFDGACCILTPQDVPTKSARASERCSHATVVDRVESFWRSLGMWTVRMAPAAHDRALAEVSHLPHAAAAALVLLSSPEAQDISGPGFMDTTRIAGGDPELWRDIFLTNAKEVASAVHKFCGKLERLADLVESGNSPRLVAWLAQAQRRRHDLMSKKLDRKQVE